MGSITYKNCKRLIENKKKRGELDSAWVEDMKMKLDVFLMNDRLSEEEYNELFVMMRPEAEE